MNVLVAQLCLTLCDPMKLFLPARLLCPWSSLDKNTGMDSLPFSGDLLHCRQILYHLNHRVNMKATKDDQFINAAPAAAAAKSLQSCPTPCDPRDGSPPGSPVPGISHWSGLPFPSPVHESVK